MMKKYWDKSQLVRIWKDRQQPNRIRPIEAGVSSFMKQVVYPRQRKLSDIGQAWGQLLPTELVEHSCLEDVRRGKLIVLVDSASHLYELQLLVQQGLVGQLRQHCPGVNLSTITLRRGIWYRIGENGEQTPKY